MNRVYNQVAGRSVERLNALSDGVFAIAMTLLVLELHLPASEAIASEAGLLQALRETAPAFAAYFLGFLTLGIFWMGQQALLARLERSDRTMSWLQIFFLSIVSLMPFATSVLAAHMRLRTAIGLYWVVLALLGLTLWFGLRHAVAHDLLGDDPQAVAAPLGRRIAYAQALYAVGALLCLASPLLSVGFIFLVQLNFAVAPRVRLLGSF